MMACDCDCTQCFLSNHCEDCKRIDIDYLNNYEPQEGYYE